MTDEEVWRFLDEPHTLQVATINPDGAPHLVAMFYTVSDGRIAFWTYGRSQKVRNLERDPRATVLVESGRSYDELKGVQISGPATISDDADLLREVGESVYRRYYGEVDDTVRLGIDHAARKRVVVLVEPRRIVSWDHAKLASA